MEPAIRVTQLSKRFGRTQALDNVTVDIPTGSVCGLIGPNGSGKTTMFSIAAGFIKPSAGHMEVLGIDVENISALRGRFSMLPQDAAFQAGIPVIQQLVMFARLNGYDLDEAKKRSQAALELVGLGDVGGRNARALSHGMFKRVALCQAFIGEPEVILLDEPTSGLDPDNARKMRDLIRDMRADQTVVISSHNLREIQEICDYTVILHEGKLAEHGAMEGITSSTFLVRYTFGDALPTGVTASLEALPHVESAEATGDNAINVALNLESADNKDEAMKAIQKVLLIDHDLVPRSVNEGDSLEARFLDITGGKYDGASGS